LCPSSGDCIPEILWCNGVQDCADDEDASCSDSFTVEPDVSREKNESESQKKSQFPYIEYLIV